MLIFVPSKPGLCQRALGVIHGVSNLSNIYKQHDIIFDNEFECDIHLGQDHSRRTRSQSSVIELGLIVAMASSAAYGVDERSKGKRLAKRSMHIILNPYSEHFVTFNSHV